MSRKSSRRIRLLQRLNLFGLDYLDPIILAALADELPLLLIGAHGTAKSELLNRVALALGLEHRHYNASLISFDDLVGYPVPDRKNQRLEYLHTPTDIWGAESVFLDEISRCKPEHQNRLFSIVHEKRIQGIALERLRYRWSAMNPPADLAADPLDGAIDYSGSLPLDVALADRFPYLVRVPSLEHVGEDDRLQIIRDGGGFEPDGSLEPLVADCKQRLVEQDEKARDWVVRYVGALVNPLSDAGFAISGRRAVALSKVVLSIAAAHDLLDTGAGLEDSGLDALRHGLPQTAQGARIDESLLRTLHKAAVTEVTTPTGGIFRKLRNTRDPVRRVRLALDADPGEIDRMRFSQLVNDAWAGLSRPRQYLFARHLLPVIRDDRLNLHTLETLLEPIGRIQAFAADQQHRFAQSRTRAREWDKLQAVVLKLRDCGEAEQIDLGNLLYTLYWVEEERFDAEELVRLDSEWAELFDTANADLGEVA